MKFFSLFFVILLITILRVKAYEEVSPICTDDASAIEKGMGGKNNDRLAVKVSVDKTSYEPGKPLKITVKNEGRVKFKGLLLFARNGKSQQVGQWKDLPSGFQTLDDQCKKTGGPKSVLSHSNGNDKETTTFTWFAPAKGEGPVEFRGIIVTEKTEWKIIQPIRVNGPTGDGKNGSTSSSGAVSLTEQIGLAFVVGSAFLV